VSERAARFRILPRPAWISRNGGTLRSQNPKAQCDRFPHSASFLVTSRSTIYLEVGISPVHNAGGTLQVLPLQLLLV
jgi:hypothetical protein